MGVSLGDISRGLLLAPFPWLLSRSEYVWDLFIYLCLVFCPDAANNFDH